MSCKLLMASCILTHRTAICAVVVMLVECLLLLPQDQEASTNIDTTEGVPHPLPQRAPREVHAERGVRRLFRRPAQAGGRQAGRGSQQVQDRTSPCIRHIRGPFSPPHSTPPTPIHLQPCRAPLHTHLYHQQASPVLPAFLLSFLPEGTPPPTHTHTTHRAMRRRNPVRSPFQECGMVCQPPLLVEIRVRLHTRSGAAAASLVAIMPPMLYPTMWAVDQPRWSWGDTPG